MMSYIDQTFRKLSQKGQVALIPFIVAGDPDLKTTEALAIKMAEDGASILELGIPFSDPIADGPVIQSASLRAIKNRVSLRGIFDLTWRLKRINLPIVLMGYFNPILRYGIGKFGEDCQKNGVSGVIIPDLPPEEARDWIREARRFNIDTIFLITPTTPPKRIKLINRCCRGFIYYVSVTGVTGTRENLPEEVEASVKRIKDISKRPVAMGFGISTPEQAKKVSGFVDGVIVGSAIVKIIGENLKSPDLINKVGSFVSSLAKALKS